MKISTILSTMFLSGLVGTVAAYSPPVWAFTHLLIGYLLVQINGERFWRRLVIVCAAGYHVTEEIDQLYDNCYSEDGTKVSNVKCGLSVTKSVFQMGLSVGAYQQTGAWGKRGDVEDNFISRVNSTVVLLYLPSNDNIPGKREGLHDAHYALLDTVANSNISSTSTAIIKGSNDVILGVINLSNTSAILQMIKNPSLNSRSKRTGFNGYETSQNYWLQVLYNSDPVTDWDDAGTWATYMTSDGESPDEFIIEADSPTGFEESIYITDTYGVAFEARSGSTDGRNAQFIAKVVSGSDYNGEWIHGMNWCFGNYPTNC